ncbi:hypothetical protein EYF80_061808 [Liparis tanakae]|uniref:Uncharacterized protein n=1 Tax=Liparis tanakae TaxID=230148 RepID=A0A4Z2EH34_9TELE|nr:hypothetical protein EYF80_061808 [Liparis tanakae]
MSPFILPRCPTCSSSRGVTTSSTIHPGLLKEDYNEHNEHNEHNELNHPSRAPGGGSLGGAMLRSGRAARSRAAQQQACLAAASRGQRPALLGGADAEGRLGDEHIFLSLILWRYKMDFVWLPEYEL